MIAFSARSRLPLALLAAWLLLTLVAASRIDQAIYSDPAWGLLAAEQWRLGLSPSPRAAVQADPRDLRRDTAGVVSWWPPAYQGLPLAFRLTGLDWGAAVRASVLLSWLSALVGWALYFRLAATRHVHWPWLVLILATSRHTHAGFDHYDGETLLLGAFPWVLLANVHALAAERARAAWAFAAGVGGAALFAVKYSALLGCVALLAAWLSACLPRPTLRACLCAASYAAGAALMFLGLHALGVPGGPTPGDTLLSVTAPARALYPFAILPLALTDLDSMVQFLFAHPTRPWLPPWQRWWIGAPLVVAGAVWLVGSVRERSAAVDRGRLEAAALRCAIAVLCVLPAVLGVMLLLGAGVDDRARHVRLAALAILPWVVDGIARGFAAGPDAGAGPRAAALLTAAVLVVLPCAYGAATLLDKAFRRASATDTRVGTSGLRLDVLGASAEARVFTAAVLAARPAVDTVVYVTSPDTAIELASARLLVRHADFTDSEDLAKQRFHGCPRGGVLLTVPSAFEHQDKLAYIREAFRDVTDWRPIEVAGNADLRVYRGDCARAGPTLAVPTPGPYPGRPARPAQ